MTYLIPRKQATILRKRGFSYNMICEKLGIAKSTLSCWLKDVPFFPNQEVIRRIGEGRLKSAKHKNAQKIQEIEEMEDVAKKEIKVLTKRDLWMLGIGIYLGEGSKLFESIRIINSDPYIIKIAIKWFKDICGLKNENFLPAVHIYPDSNEKEIIKYWSKILDIPKEKFGKTQIDTRTNKSSKKRRKLPYGTLHIYVRSRGNREYGRKLHRKIMGWIKAINNQLFLRA